MSTPTLLEILKKTTQWFESRGVPNPRLDAELIIAHCLKKKRMDLYLEFDKPLYEADLEPIRALIQRRGSREPLQHILGSTEFRYLDVLCSPAALIPRPETETLVELGLDYLKSLKDSRSELTQAQVVQVLEIGAGTGIISLSLVKESPCPVQVQALDISPDALELSQANAQHNEIEGVQWIQSDLLEAISSELRYDLIISNPPYIPQSDMAHLEPEVKDHDPSLALVGGVTGLELPAKLVEQALAHLQASGVILLELAPDQPQALAQLIQESSLVEAQLSFEFFEDLNGDQRFLSIRFA